MGTDRENVVPGNLIIISKLNEAWPLKKTLKRLLKLLKLKENSTTALRLLKFLILKKGLRCFLTTLEVFNPEKRHHHCLKVFNTKKELHHFLRTLKVSDIEKGYHYFLESLKGFNFEKWFRQILFFSCFNVELCYLAVIMIFLMVNWWLLLVISVLLLVNSRYLVVNARYWWLPLVTAVLVWTKQST